MVLLSGGLDSATTLAEAVAQGFEAFALTARYGQRHTAEIDAASRVAAALGATEHLVVDVDMAAIGGSALTSDVPVPKEPRPEKAAGEIPITYVPARNTILLALGLAWAEVLGARDLFIGVNAVDYSGYPDCRPEYIEAFERLAALATRAGVAGEPVRIRAPLLHLAKAEIIRRGTELGVDFALTVTCYDPSPVGVACGACESCRLRRAGFAQAGLVDPAPYAGADPS